MDKGGLVAYFRQHLKEGYALDELKLHLASYGVPTREISAAAREIQGDILERAPSPSVPNDFVGNSSAHVWLLLPAVLFVFLFGVLVIAGLLI